MILIIDILINNIPDEEKVIDVRVGTMRVKVVEKKFSRHELGRINEDDDESGMSVEQVDQLLFSSQIFHLCFVYIITN